METGEIRKLVNLRADLIKAFNSLRDYKNNKNAIMKESEHARLIHNTIKRIDDVLKEHVQFE